MAPYTAEALASLTQCLLTATGSQSLADQTNPTAIGDLLAQWATQSPAHRRHFNNALEAGAGRKWVNERTKMAVFTYAREIFPPRRACQLLLELQAPMTKGFRVLSQYITTLNTPSWARPVCSYNAFCEEYKALLAPLAPHPPVRSGEHCGVSWPLESWIEYIQARPALHKGIDFKGPPGRPGLHLIVRGDGYPVAGGTFCNLCISLGNHGEDGRRPAMVWPIGLATCADKDVEDLGVLWAHNIKVCALRRTGNRREGGMYHMYHSSLMLCTTAVNPRPVNIVSSFAFRKRTTRVSSSF